MCPARRPGPARSEPRSVADAAVARGGATARPSSYALTLRGRGCRCCWHIKGCRMLGGRRLHLRRMTRTVRVETGAPPVIIYYIARPDRRSSGRGGSYVAARQETRNAPATAERPCSRGTPGRMPRDEGDGCRRSSCPRTFRRPHRGPAPRARRGAQGVRAFRLHAEAIVPPPSTLPSPEYRTAACPGATARWATSNSTIALPGSVVVTEQPTGR